MAMLLTNNFQDYFCNPIQSCNQTVVLLKKLVALFFSSVGY